MVGGRARRPNQVAKRRRAVPRGGGGRGAQVVTGVHGGDQHPRRDPHAPSATPRRRAARTTPSQTTASAIGPPGRWGAASAIASSFLEWRSPRSVDAGDQPEVEFHVVPGGRDLAPAGLAVAVRADPGGRGGGVRRADGALWRFPVRAGADPPAPSCEPHASQNPSAASTGSPHDEQRMFMSRSLGGSR